MANENTLQNVTPGMDVVGTDDGKVGDVAGLLDDYLVVSKGFFFPTDYFIPLDAIVEVTDRVQLSVTKEEALHQGWDTPPADVVSAAAPADEFAAIDAGLHVDNPVDPYHVMPEAEPDDGVVGAGAREPSTLVAIPLHEDELRASTRNVVHGQARVGKVVTGEERSLDVPVNEEHATVRREAVHHKVAPGETVFTDETIEVTLHGEEVVVDKDVHIVEEVEIGTEAVERFEQVRKTVRREDARIYDEEGNLIEATDQDDRR